MTDTAPPVTALTCPVCGAGTEPGQAFCESCGSPLAGTGAPPAEALTAVEQEAPIELTRPTSAAAARCSCGAR